MDTSSIDGKSKMNAQMFVVFKPLDNHIEHVGTNAEVRFRQCDKVFAIIRINPHAVLKPHESVFPHKSPETYSHTLAPLGNIKDNNTPTTVPAPLFCNGCFLRLHLEHALAILGYSRITFAVFFNKYDEPLRRETSERGLRLIIKLGAFFVSGKILEETCRVRYRRRDEHNTTDKSRRQECFLKCSQPPFAPRALFHHSHSGILPYRYQNFVPIGTNCGYLDDGSDIMYDKSRLKFLADSLPPRIPLVKTKKLEEIYASNKSGGKSLVQTMGI